jgi:hypothetical protein
MRKYKVSEMDNGQNTLKEINNFLHQHHLNLIDKDLAFRRCFNEAWFSNTLAWLLDPKGSHNLGVSFVNEFLKTVARIRTGDSKKYARKNSLLKWGKAGSGVSSTSFSLKNASVIREFYLAKSIDKRSGRGPKYCDIALIDLDASDGLFVVVENKLFSSNHPKQLEDYYDTVETKFSRARVREYVYLTLHGHDPQIYDDKSPKQYKYWVRMSWSKHIVEIINRLKVEKEHSGIKQLKIILNWLKKINQSSIEKHVEDLRALLLQAASSCLHAELERLGDGGAGSWNIHCQKDKNVVISHTSLPKARLYLELLPNLSITLQSRRKGKPLFDKIIVPYGANTDQIYNLFDIAARDVYHYHFSDKNRYLGNKRRLTSTLIKEKEESKPVFDFVSKNHDELQILFTMSKNIWQAQKFELQESL